MLETEIKALITQGEGSALEFKRDADDLRPESMAKEIVAFANMNGGKILIGVEDNGEISGVQRGNLQEWLMDTVITRYVYPRIVPSFDAVRTKDDKQVAIVTIPQGVAKPYGVRKNGREDVYLRYGNICTLATGPQLIRLSESGGFIHVDKMPVHGSGLGDFDMKRLRNYFVDIIELFSLKEWEKLEDKEIIKELVNLDLMKLTEPNEEAICTIAGIVLFGKEPARKVPQSSIRVTVFKGDDKDYDTNMDEHVRFPFVNIKSNAKESSYADPSVPKRIIAHLKGHISQARLDGVHRVRFWDYPEDAIRELIINAFAHRDWTRNTDIEISVYSDRMEIISPGALPNGMTIEKVKAGQRTTRNTHIVNMLHDYSLMEHHGMGIRRTVIPAMKKDNKREPEFEATEDYFKVVLWKT